jgi:hypothetical protein
VNNHWAFSLSYKKNKTSRSNLEYWKNRNQIFFDLPTIKKNLILILPPSISLSNVLSLSLSILSVYPILAGCGVWKGPGKFPLPPEI